MVNTILRRSVFVGLAITLILGLASSGAGAAPAPGKPGMFSKHDDEKKKSKKKRKKAKHKPSRLWYRLTIDGTGTNVGGGSDPPSAMVTRSTWRAQSRAAVILFRAAANRSPDDATPGLRQEYRFSAGIGGAVTAGERRSTATSPVGECPAGSQSLVQTTPGMLSGTVGGGLSNGGGRLTLVTRVLPGAAIEVVKSGMCLQDPPPRSAYGPGVIICPYEVPWDVSGNVAYGGEFTIHATCSHRQVGFWGTFTNIDAALTLVFKPCPGRGTKVAKC